MQTSQQDLKSLILAMYHRENLINCVVISAQGANHVLPLEMLRDATTMVQTSNIMRPHVPAEESDGWDKHVAGALSQQPGMIAGYNAGIWAAKRFIQPDAIWFIVRCEVDFKDGHPSEITALIVGGAPGQEVVLLPNADIVTPIWDEELDVRPHTMFWAKWESEMGRWN